MLAFGQMVKDGDATDLELLEVVEGWSGPHRTSFHSSVDVPLRGRLTIYFLRPDQFEHPDETLLEGIGISAKALLHRVEQAYAVLVENPHGYAFDVMRQFDTLTDSPLTFFRSLEASHL